VEWSEERERLQQQVSTQRQRGLEKTARLEEELLALQRERETEFNKHQDSLVCNTSLVCFFDYHELNMGTLLKVCLMFVSFSQAVAGGGEGLTFEEQS